MSISSLIGLAERLLGGDNSVSAPSQKTHGRHLGLEKHQERHSGHVHGDHYTPSSTSNANDSIDALASLQFERLRYTALNVVATPSATTSATGGTTPLTNATATNASTDSSSAGNLSQDLNTQLEVLGLSAPEIQAFNQTAKLIQQFNPAAYQDLVNQLKALASQFASQALASTSVTTGDGTAAFQLTELSLRFSGVNETFNTSGQTAGGTNSTTQISAYRLQIEEVRVSLSSASGQTVQIQAPQNKTTMTATA